MTRTWRAAVVVALAALLAACGGGPAPPILDERGSGADEADGSSLGSVVVIEGIVTRQETALGEPFSPREDPDRMVVPRLELLTVDRLEGRGVVTVELIRDYVDADDATAAPIELLDLPDVELRFTVRQREDGVYECWIAPCIQEAR